MPGRVPLVPLLADAGTRLEGLRLLDGGLVLKAKRGDVTVKVHISGAGAFTPAAGVVRRRFGRSSRIPADPGRTTFSHLPSDPWRSFFDPQKRPFLCAARSGSIACRTPRGCGHRRGSGRPDRARVDDHKPGATLLLDARGGGLLGLVGAHARPLPGLGRGSGVPPLGRAGALHVHGPRRLGEGAPRRPTTAPRSWERRGERGRDETRGLSRGRRGGAISRTWRAPPR